MVIVGVWRYLHMVIVRVGRYNEVSLLKVA